MDFAITEEQEELLAELDEFCDENLAHGEVQRWLDSGGVPDWFIQKYYKTDFGNMGLPEAFGGTPTSYVTRVLLLERLAKRAGTTLPVQGIMHDCHILSHIASDEQMEWLNSHLVNTGRQGFSLAVTEAQTGSDVFNMSTTAIEEEDCFVINGAKSFVGSGQYAPFIILVAHDVELGESDERGHKPLTFFLVERDTPGIDSITIDKIGQRLIPVAELLFEEVRVPKSCVMGERGKASKVLLHSFDFGRLFVCATTTGLAEAALTQALDYALMREEAGRGILSFQQIQELIADMQIKVDSMRCMLYRTAVALDDHTPDASWQAALLKRFIPKTAMEVADSAMQIMGSMGYTSSNKAARIWQECRGNRISEGTDQVMTLVASRGIVKRAKREAGQNPSWRL